MREISYYWVKYTGEWIPALWDGETWQVAGSNSYLLDSDFDEIGTVLIHE